MSERLLVSTRKGLFVIERQDGHWRVTETGFLGDNVSLALADRRDGRWYAALDLGHFGCKLHVSEDQGMSWSELAVPSFPPGEDVPVGDGKDSQPAALKLIWSLESGGADRPARLWAGTLPGGLFRSDDAGRSWHLIRGLWDLPERRNWFGGGYDTPGIHSICVDPRNSRCLRIAISTGGVWQSDDEGATWRQCANGMFATYLPEELSRDPNRQDVHRMVQCAGAPDSLWAQHHNGVFRSVDGGANWTEVANVQPSVFGFAVAVHPREPGTAWFVPAVRDQQRIPVDGLLVAARTRDGGNSFEVLREGLPIDLSYDLVYRHGLAVEETGQHLAFGSTTGGLWISDDGGDYWQALGARLPPILAVSYAP